MKKWLLWTIICIVCVGILLFVGKYFSYTGNKVKLNSEIKPQHQVVIIQDKEIQS